MQNEKASTRHGSVRLLPRLLNATDTAAYLGYSSTAVLKYLPIKPIHLTSMGVGLGPRWDRRKLDEYLDQLSGICPTLSANDVDSSQAAFDEWEARNAAKRA